MSKLSGYIIRMGVGFFQLSNRTPQDLYLIGNPQFTHFKSVFKRHTNFAIEPLLVPFNGDTNQTWGRRLYVNIPRNGDLLYRSYLVFRIRLSVADDPNLNLNGFANSLIDWVQISIGDQIIDKHPGEWLQIFGAVYECIEKQLTLTELLRIEPNTTTEQVLYVPLRFWFTRHAGLACPLLALANADMKLELQVNPHNLVASTANLVTLTSIQLLCEFIHLDAEEKRMFASNKHEYLIEQVQYSVGDSVPLQLNNPQVSNTAYENTNFTFDIRFNHPTKELLWVVQDSSANILGSTENVPGFNLYNYWRNFTLGREQIKEATLVLNNKEVFEFQTGKFFRILQSYEYHNNNRYSQDAVMNANDASLIPCVYKYSFALHPTNVQSSGTLNLSALDKAQVRMKFLRDADNFWLPTPAGGNIASKQLRFYAVNYNILRIQSGMGAMAYIN
jgi:hypothetical protein